MTTKVIHFIRHGQSTSNLAQTQYLAQQNINPSHIDRTELMALMYGVMNQPENFDAPLTAVGKQEAVHTGRMMQQVPVELVCCSTLSRAMQTAAMVFPKPNGQIVAMDEVREFAGPPHSEQRHHISALPEHLPSNLGIDFNLFDFSHVRQDADKLWSPEEESGASARQRAATALRFLLSRPEKHIAVVAHTSFIRQCLLGRRNKAIKVMPPSARESLQVDFMNAEVRSVTLSSGAAAAGCEGEFIISPYVASSDNSKL